MAQHAGFAAALEIREGVFQDLVRALYASQKIDPVIRDISPTLGFDLFQAAPTVSFRAAEPSRFTIGIRAWNRLRVTPPGGNAETRRVNFRATIVVPVQVGLQGSSIRLAFDGWNAIMTELSIESYADGDFSAGARAYLDSDAAWNLIEFGMRSQFDAIAQVIPPIDISFLKLGLSTTDTTITLRVLDGVLALGFDVNRNGIATSGDLGQLADFTNGLDVALWTNPVLAPEQYAFVKEAFAKAIDRQGAQFTAYTFAVEEGGFRIRGAASDTGGRVTFSLKLVPTLGREVDVYVSSEYDDMVEGGPHHEQHWVDEIWFDAQEVHVDVDRDAWVSLVQVVAGVLSLGAGAVVIESIIDAMGARTRSDIDSGVYAESRARRLRLWLAGLTRPPMSLYVERLDVHADGVFAALRFSAEFFSGALVGPGAEVDVEEFMRAPIRYSVVVPDGVIRRDPELYIRWTVRRSDTNAIILTRNVQAQWGAILGLSANQGPFLETDSFAIECRVYRTLGAETEEIFAATLALKIRDRLDRSHPFVHWTHQAYAPTIEKHADGTRRQLGYMLKTRTSALHRTDLPGRCRMVASHSLKRERGPDGELEYVDELPFPRSQLAARRHELCDYCFFGGPTKTEPLI